MAPLRILIPALVVLVATLSWSAPALGAPSDPAEQFQEPRIPNLPVSALPRVSIEHRALDAGYHWNPATDRYDRAYANPSRWTVTLDGCGSSPGTGPTGVPFAMRSYEWRLEPLDGQAVAPITRTSTGCRDWAQLSALGRWRITLTTRSIKGGARQSTDQRLRDLVIVAFGDSLTAAEGNMELVTQTPTRTVRRWSDRQCHRSHHSWAMRAARKLEDLTTTVTFLNFACSGAETTDLFKGGYKGQAPTSSDARLAAQLAAARDALGDPLARSTRPIHAVLMSAGVNDAGFSDHLMDCAKLQAGGPLGGFDPIVDDPCDNVGSTRGVRSELSRLDTKYDRIDAAIGANLNVSPAAVRLMEYPARLMTDGDDRHRGCGIFSGLSPSEAQWVTNRAEELNAKVRGAVRRNGWRYIGGVRDAFRGHGYCAGDSWFRGFKDSIQIQGDHKGTVHPIAKGHSEIAQLARRTLPAEQIEAAPPARVVFEFTGMRIADPRGEVVNSPRGDGPGKISANFGVEWYGASASVTKDGQRIQYNRWIPVPADARTRIVETRGNTASVRLDMFLPSLRIEAPDSPKGFIVTGPREVHLGAIHRRAESWGEGTHVLGGDKSVQLRYRVRPELYNPGTLSRP